MERRYRNLRHFGPDVRPEKRRDRSLTVAAQSLKSTINTMVDQLNSFASEVTRVAREVGTEGTFGG